MSNTVTFDQAKILKGLGFDAETHHEYRTPVVRIFENGKAKYIDRAPDVYEITGRGGESYYGVSYKDNIPAPTVSEALDWIREEKGIACCAFYMIETIANGLNKTLWYIKYGIADQETIYNSYNVDYKYYYTHPLAESALLDSLLDYLEKK